MSTFNKHPGAIEIDGRPYLKDSRDNLVPLENIKPADLLIDEAVRKIIHYAEDLSAELARFAGHSLADVAALDDLLAQEYGVARPGGKGNRTYSTFDGLLKVKVAVADRIEFGPELHQAKALLDEMVNERKKEADAFLLALVNQAFNVDKEGKVDRAAILQLQRLEFDDPRWADVQRAIRDAQRPVGAKTYLRAYRAGAPGESHDMIPLDIASIQPTTVTPGRESLRAKCERLERSREAAIDLLHWTSAKVEDSNLDAIRSGLREALDALGGSDADRA